MAINFYLTGDEFGGLSNFSRHQVKYKGEIWPTSEHAFQAAKFEEGSEHYTAVLQAKKPSEAAKIGRDRARPLRKDWEIVKEDIMFEILQAKFSQHDGLKALLLSTGEEDIVEHTVNDAYWGDGGDGKGKNRLGHLLVRLRKEMRV